MPRFSCLGRAALALSLLGVTTGWAGFTAPGFRGEANTTYQEWDVFSSVTGPNAPDVGVDNANGTPDVFDQSGFSFLTGGGNIYAQAGVGDFVATIPDFDLGAGFLTNVVVQVKTLGAIIDTNEITWNGVAFDDVEVLSEVPLGGFGGVAQEVRFTWTSLPGNVETNTLSFLADSDSLSLDQLVVDTQAVAVPEFGSLGLVGLGSVGFLAWTRLGRRRPHE